MMKMGKEKTQPPLPITCNTYLIISYRHSTFHKKGLGLLSSAGNQQKVRDTLKKNMLRLITMRETDYISTCSKNIEMGLQEEKSRGEEGLDTEEEMVEETAQEGETEKEG